ncbi:unnamed protein product [Rotaria sp. Silwood2]|nr:unnamed protein product [Rotaria sp. Silwood2]CAF3395490.1 unnamed protein product [Rotaria sp. Silwood2]CAF3451552.1 unnamed protein product [Rotaria sp. Silwood2]CAF4494925.1 unnamed protein product [Rotaria sp. Silwood2]CAF4593552.1 unnamed protein product [Rotaria sp. Silwood2]
MGIQLDKIDICQHNMLCPGEFEDLTQAGSVYLVIRNSRKGGEDEIAKKSHFGIAIDISGLSTEGDFIATHYDLYVVSKTNYTTYVGAEFKIRKWNHYSVVRKVGQIPLNQIRLYQIPNRFAKEVEHQLISKVHDAMCELNKGAKWSSTLNCQTFTRRCVEYFGFEFPQDIKVTSDCMPTLVNLYLNGSLLTNETAEQSTETLSF